MMQWLDDIYRLFLVLLLYYQSVLLYSPLFLCYIDLNNNDYVLPDYDSLSFAKDMERDFHIYFQTDRVKVLKSDDAPLSDAMEPAIRIECNIPDDKEMESFLEQYLRQIFAKENEEL